jgi:hypothetical protein
VVVGWKYVVGFRLWPRPSPDHVLGWEVVHADADTITFEVRSALATARKVVRVYDGRVAATTFVRFERRMGRTIWSSIAPVHHLNEPYLLRHAASHSKSRTS